MNGVPADVPPVAVATAGGVPAPAQELMVDLLPAAGLGLSGLACFLGGALALVTGDGAGRAWSLAFLLLGVLSVLCAKRLMFGPPPMWLVFVQANLLTIAMDTLDRKLLATSHRLPWRAWVLVFVVWGAARLVNLRLRRRDAAGATPAKAKAKAKAKAPTAGGVAGAR